MRKAFKTTLALGSLSVAMIAAQSSAFASGGYSPDASSVNQSSHSLWIGAWITAGGRDYGNPNSVASLFSPQEE